MINLIVWTDWWITFLVMILTGVTVLGLTLVWNFLMLIKSLLDQFFVFGFLEVL